MATIYLSLSSKTDANNQREILIRFSHGKINQRAKTNIFLSSKYWNTTEQQISIPKARLLNNETKALIDSLNAKKEKLSNLTATVLKYFNEADKSNILPDWLKNTIDKINFPEKYEQKAVEPEIKALFQFIDDFIKNAPERKDKKTGRELTYNNIQQYKATEKHIKAFATIKKVKDFEFEQIDKTFYNDFVSYLQKPIQLIDENGKPVFNDDKTPKLSKESFTQNSVGKHIRILKLILNEATIQGYNTNAYYNSYHVFTEDVDNVYLDETELQKLKDKDFSKTPYYDRVRDWFLLLAWTGCRFSDLEKITETDIKDNFITFRQQKTNTKVTIPLHPVVLEILKKYNYQMPEPITNQRFNEYIKNACELAEIKSIETMTRTVGGKLITEKFEKWEQVSSHTGRRSFCTNMYKRGLPTLMIMSISGHRTEKSFLKYIKVTQKEHAEMMAKKWKEIYK